MGLKEHSDKPPLFLDGLYCEEEHFEDEDLGHDFYGDEVIVRKAIIFPFKLLEQDLVEEDDELVTLKSKEKETRLVWDELNSDGSLMVARKEAVEWMIKVNAHYGFSSLTCVLAVNYFDRFVSSLWFQKDKPWMSQLVAVACLSLAAKVEETQVPLLIDLQVEESKYVFEARTIKRMELLVLSTLEWKMNPVTPLSLFDHIMRRLGFKTNLHWEFMWRCERLLLSIIADSRTVCYLPSVLAAATMLYAIQEIEPCNSFEYQNQLMGALKISKDEVDDCYKLIVELSSHHDHNKHQIHKRKHHAIPGSPNGVIDVSFSCDSLNDSWAMASSITSSSEPLYKKSRAQDQQMRLPPLTRVSMDVLSSPS